MRIGRGGIATVMAAAVLAGCQTAPPPPPAPLPAPPPVAQPAPFSQVGLASWYGAQFDSKRTAKGERFDENALTAAHRTLPLNSVVRVTNLENGRSVVVRINDRGPFAANRIIDLSAKAARELGMKDDGVVRVRLELVSGGASL